VTKRPSKSVTIIFPNLASHACRRRESPTSRASHHPTLARQTLWARLPIDNCLASICEERKPVAGVRRPAVLSLPPPRPSPTAEENRWFSEEVHVHESSLRAYLRTCFPFASDIDDVVQEAFLRLWKVRMAQPVRYAKALLFKVARHVVIDSARRNLVSPIVRVTDLAALPVLDGVGPGPDEVACAREEVALLASAIDALPARCREILILRKLRGVSQKAIAAQLGLSEQTVQVQVSRGVRRCEEFLKSRGVRPPSDNEAPR